MGEIWLKWFYRSIRTYLPHFLTNLHVFGLILTGKSVWVAGRGCPGMGTGWPGIPPGLPMIFLIGDISISIVNFSLPHIFKHSPQLQCIPLLKDTQFHALNPMPLSTHLCPVSYRHLQFFLSSVTMSLHRSISHHNVNSWSLIAPHFDSFICLF